MVLENSLLKGILVKEGSDRVSIPKNDQYTLQKTVFQNHLPELEGPEKNFYALLRHIISSEGVV